MPGDLVFLFAGALPLAVAMVWGYLTLSNKSSGAHRVVEPSTASRSP